MVDPKLLAQLEETHGLAPGILTAVMNQESGGKADAVSPKGARGYFQFMPETAQEYGVTDPTNFRQAATGAAKYLSNLYSQFGNWEDALRAYNWGQGNLRKYKKGERKDMPDEAAMYPQSVFARMQNPPASKEAAMPPDVDGMLMPPDLDTPADVDAPKSTDPMPVDWQAKLKEMPGTSLLPAVGGLGGSVLGGMAAAPTVVGAIPGAAAGGTIGAMMGHALAIRNSDAPIEEKLKYLLGQFNVEALVNMAGTKGVMALQNTLARTSAERLAIEEWFRKNGSEIAPVAGEMSGRAHRVYKNAERDMSTTVDESIGNVLRELNAQGTPTDAGKLFQLAWTDAKTKIGQQHDAWFAPFKHGTTLGDMPTEVTPSLRKAAQAVLQNFKDVKTTNRNAAAGPDIIAMMQEFAKGKQLPLATLVARKRALGDTATWDNIGGNVDNRIRQNLYTEIDKAIEAQLGKAGPNALTQWNSVNAAATRQLGILRDTMITKMASNEKMDPMEVTEYVAKNASPSAVTAYKKALGLLQQQGSITKEQNAYLMDHVRRNWIELNMNNSKSAANMYDSILGSGKNAEAVDAFNAVFAGSPYKSVLEEAARAAHTVAEFGKRIPPQSGGSGEYVTAMAAGGLIGQMFGNPAVGSSLGAGLVFLTNAVPRAIAKAQLRNDSMLRNQTRFVVNWLNQASPSDLKSVAAGNFASMPANVFRAYQAVEAAANE